ncbi:2OG-Fe(II) oxygenase, partial [Planktothrix sp. FACHB-1355]
MTAEDIVTNFIEIYDNALDADICHQIIEKFETSDKIVRGRTGQGVDLNKKDSYDLTITGLYEWRNLHSLVVTNTFAYLKQYLRKYIFALVGAISPGILDPISGKVVTLTHENFAQYEALWMDETIQKIYRPSWINVQKYIKGMGGYHHWHSEIYPHPREADDEPLRRVLFFQYYLNTVNEGGETEFFYQNLKVKPQQGRLAIAPAG